MKPRKHTGEKQMDKHSIGKTITTLRKAKGWTQVELAEKLDVSDKAISKWEKDAGVPSIEFFPHLAQLFDVTIDYLITGHESILDEKENNLTTAQSLYEQALTIELENPTKLVELLTKSAEMGYGKAQIQLGIKYIIQKNGEKAIFWLSKAANNNEKTAALLLSAMYSTANLVELDLNKSKYWSEKANVDANTSISKTDIYTLFNDTDASVEDKLSAVDNILNYFFGLLYAMRNRLKSTTDFNNKSSIVKSIETLVDNIDATLDLLPKKEVVRDEVKEIYNTWKTSRWEN